MTLLLSLIQRCFNPLWRVFQSVLRRWTKPDNRSVPLNTALDLDRTKSELMLENTLLRQQIIILERQSKRPRLSWRDRAIIVLLTSRLRTWKTTVKIVQPETVSRWHRDLFRQVWARKSKPKGKPGRPPLDKDTVALIKRMAQENRRWGAERIVGELAKLGIRVSKPTVQKYIQQVREAEPSNQNWATFLRNHASQIWAARTVSWP